MNKAQRGFLSAFTLTSRIPVRASFEPDYSRADFWLVLVAPFASSAALAGAFLGQLAFGSPLFVALFAMACQYLAFNLFHLDGLLDSADAMLCMASPEKRLDILKDSRIGVYAFFAGFLALAARLASLARLADWGSGLSLSPNLIAALLAAPLAGRAACALVPTIAAPAREKGLGALMRGFSRARVAAGFLVGLAPLALWAVFAGRLALGAAAAAIALASAILSAFSLARLYAKRVGGFTGDALGAAVELGELLALLASAAVLPALGFLR